MRSSVWLHVLSEYPEVILSLGESADAQHGIAEQASYSTARPIAWVATFFAWRYIGASTSAASCAHRTRFLLSSAGLPG